MADITKVPITKLQGSVHDSLQINSEVQSIFGGKSELNLEGSRMGDSEMPIELGDEKDEVISDFDEPEEKEDDLMNEVEEVPGYKNL